MREHEVNSSDNFICGWYMENTTLCDTIIDFHKNSKEKNPGLSNLHGEILVNKNIKDSVDCLLTDPVSLPYFEHLKDCMWKYVEKYKWCNEYDPWGVFEAANIQHYYPGGGYHVWHTERSTGTFTTSRRHLVFMTYLNDVTDDGETEFFYQKLKVKPEKGLTLIWPADWTFTHRGISSQSQEKYIVTGWFSFIKRD